MGEANWLNETTPTGLLAQRIARDPRKRQLVGCAAARRILGLLTDERFRLAVEAAERFADGELTWEQMKAGPRKAAAAARKAMETQAGGCPEPVWHAALAVVSATGKDGPLGALELGRYAAASYSRPDWDGGRDREEAAQVAIVRDIFGNLFRPVVFDPSWRTSTVVALAEQMYGSRDFAPMPVLADALQDAGCDSEDILAHCRGDGPHVRGCWVVDLVLGKN